MDLRCFKSTLKAALNAQLLYDGESDTGNYWSRVDLQKHLPTCSTSDPPMTSDWKCLVCKEQEVFAVCRQLPEGVKMIMEALGENVKISESECPQLLAQGVPSWVLPFAIICILFILILLVWTYIKYGKKCIRGTKAYKREENKPAIQSEGH